MEMHITVSRETWSQQTAWKMQDYTEGNYELDLKDIWIEGKVQLDSSGSQ
jgi:hypothetical protein